MKTLTLIFTLILLLAASLQADTVLYSNLEGFNQYQAQAIYGSQTFNTDSYEPAMSFVSGSTGVLSQIDLALGWAQGLNAVYVNLDADNNSLPGATLMSWELHDLPVFGQAYAPQTAIASRPLILDAGVRYWIEVWAGGNDTLVGWNWNGAGATGLDAFQINQAGTWHAGDPSQSYGNPIMAAFDVIDAAVPTVPEANLGWWFLLAGIGLAVSSRFEAKSQIA